MIYAVREFFSDGGWTAVVLAILSVVLYFFISERFLATFAELRLLKSGRRISPEVFEIPGLRRMAFIRAGIVTAPLLGLFGTVTGMIDVFGEISAGGLTTGVGGGVSKAMLTTQYGLVIAAPALIAEKILLTLKQKIVSESRSASMLEDLV